VTLTTHPHLVFYDHFIKDSLQMLYIKTHEKFCKSKSKSKNKENVFCFPKRKRKCVHMIPKYGYINAIVRITSERDDQAEQPTRKF
jgi:hypothetical protein